MLTAGDEFGRSQRGNNNAYAQDNETRGWTWAHADQNLIQHVAGLAKFGPITRPISLTNS